jgi:autotransporter-associated beta strand protein
MQRTINVVIQRKFIAVALALASSAPLVAESSAQTFEPNSGTHAWNDNINWGPSPPQPFPNSAGAAAVLPSPTGLLTIDLGQPITIGSLTFNKSTSIDAPTVITGTAANNLTFAGGGTIFTTPSFAEGSGPSEIIAPITFDGTLTLTHGDDGILRLTGPVSGAGNVTINRDTNGTGFVAFNGANTYSGTTTVTGNGGTSVLVLRLNEPNALPGGIDATGGTGNLILSNSAILGLGINDFKRSYGTGPDQFQFVTAGGSGFAAYDATRIVNIGGASASVAWADLGLGTFTFGAESATGTVDFQNPLNLGNANRTIRALDGSVGIEARITGSITSTGIANNLTKTGLGTISLAAANSYTGNTIINGGVLLLEHAQALPATTNVNLTSGGILGLGLGDYDATLGTGPGQLQFTTANGGFAAFGGTRTITLNGGAQLVWATGNFVGATSNLVLSNEGADGTIVFANPIDLNGATRTIAGRDGSAAIDAEVSGVISGTGGLVKNQSGVLKISAVNTYTGDTEFRGGVLLLTNPNSVPGGINGGSLGNLKITGGSVGLGYGDFTAPIGSGPGQVSFEAATDAEFAAYGGDRTVNFGGASATLTWGVDGFWPTRLIFSAQGSDGTVILENPINLNGAQRTLAARRGDAEIDGLVKGVISGSGGVLLAENINGTLAFSAENTYDGGTIIDAGRLLVNNTAGSGVGTGDVVVTQGGTLGGIGFVGTGADPSNVTLGAGAHLAPGVTTGKLTVNGDVSLSSTSFFDIQIGGLLPGTDFDQLAINGAASLSGTLNVELLNGFANVAGETFEVLSASGGITGEFDSIASIGDISWRAVYGTNSVSLVAAFGADFDEDGDVDSADLAIWQGGYGTQTGATKLDGDSDNDGDVDGRDFLAWQRQFTNAHTLSAISVPEPSVLSLLGLASALLAMIRRPSEV